MWVRGSFALLTLLAIVLQDVHVGFLTGCFQNVVTAAEAAQRETAVGSCPVLVGLNGWVAVEELNLSYHSFSAPTQKNAVYHVLVDQELAVLLELSCVASRPGLCKCGAPLPWSCTQLLLASSQVRPCQFQAAIRNMELDCP